MIFLVASLWTIFWHDQPTVLQYPTERECHEAIAAGLPYRGVPPPDQLSCILAADANPIEVCSDGSQAYLRNGLTCQRCIDKDGRELTSVLCEGHGYRTAR